VLNFSIRKCAIDAFLAMTFLRVCRVAESQLEETMACKFLLVVLTLGALVCTPAFCLDRSHSRPGRIVAQQADLLPLDGQQYSFFGQSIAVSGDTVVVGSPGYSDDMGNEVPGYAYVFVKPPTGWMNMIQTAELKASDQGSEAGNGFGTSVAIAGDTIVVGAPGVSEVYIFVKPAGGWKNMTETSIVTDRLNGTDAFGCAVAINASGNTIVIGADEAETARGVAYLAVEPSGGWQSMEAPTASLTASDGVRNDLFGNSVAIDGSTVAVGAFGKPYPQDYGAAYVFVEPATGWTSMTQTAELNAAVPILRGSLGTSVAILGNTVAAGAYGGTGSQPAGNVYVFVEPGGGWQNMTETARLTDGNTVEDDLGSSVAMNDYGILAGAPLDTVNGNMQQGSDYAFLKPKAGWKSTSKFSLRLTAMYGATGDRLGTSLAIGPVDVVSGAPGTNGIGEAYVFFKK
jgi:hypothetical protein